jgi:hypothetical protein
LGSGRRAKSIGKTSRGRARKSQKALVIGALTKLIFFCPGSLFRCGTCRVTHTASHFGPGSPPLWRSAIFNHLRPPQWFLERPEPSVHQLHRSIHRTSRQYANVSTGRCTWTAKRTQQSADAGAGRVRHTSGRRTGGDALLLAGSGFRAPEQSAIHREKVNYVFTHLRPEWQS